MSHVSRVKVTGIYKPGNTSYQIYEATLINGDTHAEGAFSEEDFREKLLLVYKKREIKSVKIYDGKDIGNGYRETTLD